MKEIRNPGSIKEINRSRLTPTSVFAKSFAGQVAGLGRDDELWHRLGAGGLLLLGLYDFVRPVFLVINAGFQVINLF